MNKEHSSLKKLPNAPGVYFFLGRSKKILYIGKATSLKSRVKSYFTKDLIEKRSALIEKMVMEAIGIEFTKTDSVLEAMILESNLIRTHKPPYNSIAKDEKSYNHLIITNEDWPRVLVVRGKDLTEKFTDSDIKYHFGPFPNADLFRQALKIIRRLFVFYDTKKPIESIKSKVVRGQIDFNRQLGLYPNNQDKVAYDRTIRHLRFFFEGKKNSIIKELDKEMMALAKEMRFEEAALVKKRIFALKHIEDVSLIKDDLRSYRSEKRLRIEGYDVAHLQGSEMVGSMVVLESGMVSKKDYRRFKIRELESSNDPKALGQIFERRLKHKEWPYPQIIVVDGNSVQVKVVQKILTDHQLSIPVIGVVKNNKHKPERLIGNPDIIKLYKAEILLVNSEAHRFAISYHRESREKKLFY